MQQSNTQRLHNVRILVIDDHPHDIEHLLNALCTQGAELTIESLPRKGLQQAQILSPDLILLDVHMPDLDGFAVCRLLHEIPSCKNIPVIFLTSAADINDRVSGLTLGGVDYVLKPFDTEEVLARIAVHVQLAKRSSSEQLRHGYLQDDLHPDKIILQAAIRQISRQLNNLPKLTELAKQVGTHDKKLSAIFRQHLGITVFSWVREQRLSKAQELLTYSSMSIEDISVEVGFASAANFATAFRERFSVTPSAYRQQVLQSP